jgi:Concanavalin A-like lectin/glucanases superfamily
LPANAAQEATNCKLWSGELIPWRDLSLVNNPSKTGPLKTIYPLTNGASTFWTHWAEDVDVRRGPISGDTTERSYYTGTDAPRVTDNVLVNTGLASGSLLHFDGDAGITTITDENTANTWVASGNAVISAVQSRFDGKSLLLDGTGDYVTGAAVALAPGTGFNRSIWFRATTLTTARTLISATADFKFAVKISATQKLELYLGDAASWSIANGTAGAATIATAGWYRVRIAWNGTTYKVYLSVNGAVETEQISVASAVAYSSGAGTRLGADHAGTLGFDGHLDEYRDVVATTVLGLETPPGLAYLPSAGYPKMSYLLGVPAPTAAPTVALGGAGTGTALARAYVNTFVTGWGEESAPSPASTIVSVKVGETVTVNAFAAVPAGDYNITLRRIYRVVTGVTGAEYLFVAEIVVATASYVDSLLDSQLGEVLATTGWLPPPAGLTGLIALPNGVMAGFVGNQVYLSVPYAPYAWPLAYRQVTDYPVVALGHFGTTIVAATQGNPYIINGVDPAYAAPSQYPGILPCVSKRGLVSTEYGVLYPSSTGLVRVTSAGAEVITLPRIDADDWQELKPATIHAVFYNGMYIAFYSTGVVDGITQGEGFILEGIGRGELHKSRLDIYRYATHLDAGTNNLYVADFDGASNTIEQWEAAITRKPYLWKSKKYPHRPTCWQAGKVVALYSDVLDAEQVALYQALHDAQIVANAAVIAAGAGIGAINGAEINLIEINGNGLVDVIDVPVAESSSVELKVYSDGVLRFQQSITDKNPFRMPGGYEGSETEIEVSGVAPCQEIVVATSIAELADS